MINTEKLWVNSSICRIHDADELVTEFAKDNGISEKDCLRMSLLAEETMGMARYSLRDFEGELWLEKTDKGYVIILEANIRANDEKNAQGLSSPEGFMSKIAEMLNCSYVFEDISEMPEDLKRLLPNYISYGMERGENDMIWTGAWSLSSYRTSLSDHSGDEGTVTSLDELEKSIVASIADDVTVGIIGNKIRLAIYKTL